MCQDTSKHVWAKCLLPTWQPSLLRPQPFDRAFEQQLLLLLRSYRKYIITCLAAVLALTTPLEPRGKLVTRLSGLGLASASPVRSLSTDSDIFPLFNLSSWSSKSKTIAFLSFFSLLNCRQFDSTALTTKKRRKSQRILLPSIRLSLVNTLLAST